MSGIVWDVGNWECTARDIELGHRLVVPHLGHDLLVTRVEHLGGLVWVEGCDPAEMIGLVATKWASVLLDEADTCQLRMITSV